MLVWRHAHRATGWLVAFHSTHVEGSECEQRTLPRQASRTKIRDENSLCWRCRMAILGKITRWHASRCTGSRTMTATRSRSLWEFRFLSVHVPTIRLNYEGVAWIPKFISPRFYPWTIAWWIIPRDRAWASFQINYSKDDHLSNTLSCLARNCYFERIIH